MYRLSILCLTITLICLYYNIHGQTVQLTGKVNFPKTQLSCTTCVYCLPGSEADTANVQNVKIRVENIGESTSAQDTTDSAGVFDVDIEPGFVKIIPTINTPSGQLSILDLIFIQRHRTQVDTLILKCPFRRIAADLDNDGDIDSLDQVELSQAILGVDPNFPAPPSRFIPKSYVAQRETHPFLSFLDDFWNNAYADSLGREYPFNAQLIYNGITYTYVGSNTWMDTLQEWILNPVTPCNPDYWGFYVVKTGDVNGSQQYTSVSLLYNPLNEELEVVNNDTTSIPQNINPPEKKFKLTVRAKSPLPIQGYQMGFYIDPNYLELDRIQPDSGKFNQKTDRDFHLRSDEAQKGFFRTIWTTDFRENSRGIQINESTELFSLVVKPMTELNRADVSRYFLLRDDILKSEFCSNYEVIPDIEVFIDIIEFTEETDR